MRVARHVVTPILSVAGHLAIVYMMSELPRSVAPPRTPATVAIRVLEPAPPPAEPPPEPRAPEPAAPRPVHERPRQRPVPQPPREAAPTEREAPLEPTPSAGTSTTPIFGITLQSTSSASSGPVLPVGNSAQPSAKRQPVTAPVPALEPPVAAYEVTRMPLPQGRCAGRYTDAAKAAGVEGTVVLDVIVNDDGRVREVSVVSGLGHGLTEAAIAAVKECRFSPGEKDGVPVPVRVRGFKIRFVLNE